MRQTIITCAMAAALLAAGNAGAAECKDCHDGVDAAKLAKTAHGKLGQGDALCRKCHGTFEVTDDGHEAPAKVECATCHKDAAEKWARGVHKAENGEGKPTCTTCHGGGHDVGALEGDTATHRARVDTMCGQCHGEEVRQHDASLHGKSMAKKPATCEDCHGAHEVRSPKDPDSSVYRLNQAATCAQCHADAEDTDFTAEQVQTVKNYFATVHGLAISKGGMIVAATCVDCHGSHTVGEVSKPDSPVARAKVPETCGKCHPGVLKTFMESVHGGPLREGNTDVPVCTDCHSSHGIQSHLAPGSTVYATNVAQTCLKCHADANFLNKYSIPGQRVETYQESYHGAAAKLGDARVANCASCHNSHDIRASSDPKSSTYPTNMAKTCGQCHTMDDPSRPLIRGKIHQGLAEENHWITGIVRIAYIFLVAGTIGFFCLYILFDLIRIARTRKAGH